MLTKRTCLLLGAGASAHLRFPLGNGLKRRLVELLGECVDRDPKLPPDDLSVFEEDIPAFYRELAYGSASSPDKFLEDHPEFRNTGKYLMACELSSHEKEREVVLNGGWYDRLVRAIHVDHHSKLKDNQLSIVTFNYDRSLDFRLHQYVQHGLRVDDSGEAWNVLTDAIPIVHVHGRNGAYPDVPYGERDNLRERSREIKIVSEATDDLEEFSIASKLLNEAERVIVVGFGFGADNVRRLKFFNEGVGTDEREIRIAAGPQHGPAFETDRKLWMEQWGLLPDRHYFNLPSDPFFDYVRNLLD